MKTSYASARVIVAVSLVNPRKPGTQGHANWEAQKFPCTYAEYTAACPTKIAGRDHLDWDRSKGWVRFEDETLEQAKAALTKGTKVPAAPQAPAEPDVFVTALNERATEVANEAALKAAEVDARLEEEKPLSKTERKALRRKVA